MHLKTLTLKGFKSFASSTTLRLEPGITAVVGPNGSGKSNVVDALTWVMGEQGAKNLRGGTMADVIFAGAGSRPALGRAEVSLTIDNSDGALPIDYTEVTVTRTLFRGGGSEYHINGTPCRLLDVQELLSDTGLGRQMHVIVGQGRLDTVLQATPEERRGFIEEAAGVLKHRKRKERALRKLDSMAADLTRLQDLTRELHRQLGPLARQAAVARRAQTIQAEVRDATARLLADDVVQVQALLEAGEEDREALAARRTSVEEAQAAARADLDTLSQVEAASAGRLAQATATWEELSSAAQSFQALEQVAAERLRGLASYTQPALGTDPQELERRAEHAAQEEEELARCVEEARDALDEASLARETAEEEHTRTSAVVDTLQRAVSERREKLARAGGRVASARSRHEAATAALEQARTAESGALSRLAAAREALAVYRASQPGFIADADRGPDPASHPGAGLAEQERAQAAHEEASAALEAAREAVSQANEARREAASQRASWTTRRDTLALSVQAQDATADLAGSDTEGVFGPLAEFLSIERGWENAIAALLGERATAALVRDEQAAVQALSAVHDTDAGALRLAIAHSPGLPEQTVQTDSQQTDPRQHDRAHQVAAEHGAKPAAAIAHAKNSDSASLIAALLRDGFVVDTIEQARALREAIPTATVATRTGDLLAPGWAATPGRGTSSVLELVAAREEAIERAAEAAAAEAEAEQRLAQARETEAAARHNVAQALASLREADAQAAKAAEEAARLTSAEHAASDEAARATRVRERAEEELATRVAELAAATQALAELEGPHDTPPQGNPNPSQPSGQASSHSEASSGVDNPGRTDLEAELATALGAREQAAVAAKEARAAETEARLALRTAEERARSMRGRADSLRAAARRERQAREEARRRAQKRQAQMDTAQFVRRQAARVAAAAADWVREAAQQRTAIESERAEAAAQASDLRTRIDGFTRQIAELTDAAHRDEVARAEHRMRLQALAERAMSELGLELEHLVEEFGPHMPVPEIIETGDGGGTRPGEHTSESQHAGEGGHTSERPGTNDTHQAHEDAKEEPETPERVVRSRPYVRAEQEKRLAKASRDLARLGKVNPLALEEHAALAERHRFLAEQLADLTRSREDLLRIVEEIDARVLEVFTSAWEDTAREFEQVFARLFPGGQGRLELTNPDDMLTTGIEIHARPAGKKVSRLSLLSGGERSLAAVALLVAIFKARPSPFYVMDEVEAALDDTNLGRLLEIFRELRDSSQLIVITHQKRTMEVADALYGISMREGVTQVVSQRLERADSEAH